jgi:hypothetical protein
LYHAFIAIFLSMLYEIHGCFMWLLLGQRKALFSFFSLGIMQAGGLGAEINLAHTGFGAGVEG